MTVSLFFKVMGFVAMLIGGLLAYKVMPTVTNFGWPHVVAIALFLVLCLALIRPPLIDGWVKAFIAKINTIRVGGAI